MRIEAAVVSRRSPRFAGERRPVKGDLWSLSNIREPARLAAVKKDESIAVRIPGELREALERERQRRSKRANAEVPASAVIRSLLEASLRSRKKA